MALAAPRAFPSRLFPDRLPPSRHAVLVHRGLELADLFGCCLELQIANPYNFSFDTAMQETLGALNPAHQTVRLLVQSGCILTPPLAPGQIRTCLQEFKHRQPARSGFGGLPTSSGRRISKSLNRNRWSSAPNSSISSTHPNFGLPGGGSGDQIPVDFPGAAAITNTASDNRQVQFALKYTF